MIGSMQNSNFDANKTSDINAQNSLSGQRPVTRFINSVAMPTKLTFPKSTVSIDLPAIYSPLPVTTIVNHHYQILKILSVTGRLNCYLVQAENGHLRWCGHCGQEIEHHDDYCPQCGFGLENNTLLLLEGDKMSTYAFRRIMKAQLKHDGLMPILDRFHYENHFYVVTVNWDGQTLASRQGGERISLFNWILVLGNALDYLHEHEFYNFDLAPQNILIRPDGPKLIGFWNSKHLNKQKESHKKLSRSERRDLVAYGRLIQKMVAMNENQINSNGFWTVVNEYATKAINGGFRNISHFMEALFKLKQHVIQTPKKNRTSRRTPLLQKNANGTIVSIGKSSDMGEVRKLNEDSVATYEFTSILESVAQPMSFCIVSDGMGGHQNGEIASRLAIQNLSEYVTQKLFKIGIENKTNEISEADVRTIVHEGVVLANEKVYQIARAKSSDMGATILASLIINRTAYIYNVGDCRAYHVRNREMNLISQDHSLVYRLFKTGQIAYQDIFTHPQRNQILRCLGEPELEKNLVLMDENGNHPYWFSLEMQKGDALVLCSDGLWEMVPENTVMQIVNENENPQTACDELIRLANEQGGEDNISVIVIKMS